MRTSEYDIDPMILNRHSPRAMSGESMSDEELMPLFEAARWAPSSYNAQLWRFIYAKRDSEHWDKLFNFLNEGNQGWAKNAAVLVVLCSRKEMDYKDKPAVTHTLDAGAAWENLALEGSKRGFVVHGMEGFDYDKAKEGCEIPDNYVVLAMIAIGKAGKTEDLPEQMRAMEEPNGRRPLSDIIMVGKFEGERGPPK